MATSTVTHRTIPKGPGAQEHGIAAEPVEATPTDATLEWTTHTAYLTRENIRQQLPKLLQQLVSPSEDVQAAVASRTREAGGSRPSSVQEMLAAAHFAADAQLSHPFGYAIGRQQIGALLRGLNRVRSTLFPRVELMVLRCLFDEQHESAAMEVKAVMHMRGLGLTLPVLAEVFCELVDRRDGHPGLCITFWSEHYSLRSLALWLPGPLARWGDWKARRAVAVVAEQVAGAPGQGTAK